MYSCSSVFGVLAATGRRQTAYIPRASDLRLRAFSRSNAWRGYVMSKGSRLFLIGALV
jgi:hypothetical protein